MRFRPGRCLSLSETPFLFEKMAFIRCSRESPWQRAYVERVIGTNRRESLEHLIVFNEASLRRTICLYIDYYHRSRTHLFLDKDSPELRAVEPPKLGPVVSVPQVGGRASMTFSAKGLSQKI